MEKIHLDQHISKQFDSDLEELKSRMLEMGGLVERQVSDALKRGWKRLGSRHRGVALALPAAMVINKKIIVPSGQKEE